MDKRYILPVIAPMASCLPLSSQTDFEYNLTRHKGNKIVLLGDWKAADAGKWKDVIDSDNIYGHSFTLLNRNNLKYGTINPDNARNIEAFLDRNNLEAVDMRLKK